MAQFRIRLSEPIYPLGQDLTIEADSAEAAAAQANLRGSHSSASPVQVPRFPVEQLYSVSGIFDLHFRIGKRNTNLSQCCLVLLQRLYCLITLSDDRHFRFPLFALPKLH